jgi:hypothetical protein
MCCEIRTSIQEVHEGLPRMFPFCWVDVVVEVKAKDCQHCVVADVFPSV